MFFAFSPFRFRWAVEASRWLQDGPRRPQERPKRGPRRPQERPRAPQERPKRAPRGDFSGPEGGGRNRNRLLFSSIASKMAQESLQGRPEGPKRAPKPPQEGPKRAPRGPKRLPQCPQEGSTMAPIGLQGAPRANDRTWYSFCGGYLGVLVLADLGGCSFARFFAESSFSQIFAKVRVSYRQLRMISALRKSGCFGKGWWGFALRE